MWLLIRMIISCTEFINPSVNIHFRCKWNFSVLKWSGTFFASIISSTTIYPLFSFHNFLTLTDILALHQSTQNYSVSLSYKIWHSNVYSKLFLDYCEFGVFYFWVTPRKTQTLHLDLCSGVIWDAGFLTQVSSIQDKCPTYCKYYYSGQSIVDFY